MDSGSIQWSTKVAADYFKIPETTHFIYTILLSLPKKERYVYKLSYNNKEYILKGFTFKIPQRQLDILKYQTKLFKVFQKIQLVYSEYYLTKSASLFSPHFCKPLNIDHKLKIEPDESEEPSTYVIEILQEYGGQPLDKIAKGTISTPLIQVFNLMYQSAHALAFLHHIGTAHMDLKPANIVYDKTLDTVRMIDFGSSTSATQSVKLHKGTMNIEGKLRDLTPEFAAPEVLKRYKDPYIDAQLVLSSVDIYCWGMTFYSLLMKKSSKELLTDVETFKLKENKEYQNYLSRIEKEFSNYKIQAKEETEMKTWVQNSILKSIAFLPEERPRFDYILSSLTETLRAILPYEKKAQEERRKLLEKIAGTNLQIESVVSHSAAGALKTGGIAEEECKKLKKEVIQLGEQLQLSMNQLGEKNERNCQLEENINELQKKIEENQIVISQLKKERETQDYKIAELMSKEGDNNVKLVAANKPAKKPEKKSEENKTKSPSKLVTPKKDSEKVNSTAISFILMKL